MTKTKPSSALQKNTELLRIAFKKLDDGEVFEAIRDFKTASKCGSLVATSMLGHIYADHISPPDFKTSVKWYKIGARRGNPISSWNLAMHYASVASHRWYEYWLTRAAVLGDEDAAVEKVSRKWWKKLATKNGGKIR